MKLIDKLLILSFVINTIGLGVGIDFNLTGLAVVFTVFLVVNIFVGLHRYTKAQ